MKAVNPEILRPVKVKSTYDKTEEEITHIMYRNSKEGLIPEWKEILDESVPQLDTETLFETGLHQTTIPFPVDRFPFLETMSAQQAYDYAQAVCVRERWRCSYENILIVLNQMDMSLND